MAHHIVLREMMRIRPLILGRQLILLTPYRFAVRIWYYEIYPSKVRSCPETRPINGLGDSYLESDTCKTNSIRANYTSLETDWEKKRIMNEMGDMKNNKSLDMQHILYKPILERLKKLKG